MGRHALKKYGNPYGKHGWEGKHKRLDARRARKYGMNPYGITNRLRFGGLARIVPLVALGAVAIGAMTLLKKWKLRRMFSTSWLGSRLPWFNSTPVSTLPSTSVVTDSFASTGYSTGSIEGGETVTTSGNNYRAPIVNSRKVPIRDRLKSKVMRRPVVTQYY